MSGSIICPKCKSFIDIRSIYCPACGYKINLPPPPNAPYRTGKSKSNISSRTKTAWKWYFGGCCILGLLMGVFEDSSCNKKHIQHIKSYDEEIHEQANKEFMGELDKIGKEVSNNMKRRDIELDKANHTNDPAKKDEYESNAKMYDEAFKDAIRREIQLQKGMK